MPETTRWRSPSSCCLRCARQPWLMVREAESKDERLDRELIELLNELRVALPGVQMLFGFLLALPFSVGFEHTSTGDRRAYFTSFIAAAAASILLIAPPAYHRLLWRPRD